MLENIIQIIKEQAGEVLNNDTSIPADKKDSVIHTTAESVHESLASQLSSGGGIGAITSLFNHSTSNSADLAGAPGVSNITSHVAESLIKKAGIENSTATRIASAVIPLILSKLINKTNDPNDKSLTLDGIIGSLTKGGNAGGILDNIKGLF